MVGVPGKYKGCNTCRLRRVKCDNTRPLCRKCVDGGRECGGYERETVFIVGTIEDGGRCSSHPPRVVKKDRKGRSSPRKSGEEQEKLDILCYEPLRPAWDDLVIVSNQGNKYYLQISALHLALHHVARGSDESIHAKTHLLHFPPYEPFSIRTAMKRGDFQMKAQCLIHLAPTEASPRASPSSNISTESVCLFLYEHNWSHGMTDQGPWKEATADANTVRRLGPENFQTFPNHHFFVRLFRHNATCSALLNRRSTFLSSPEWLATPWELHPKSAFDKLFDSLVLLPSLLSRTDLLLAAEPTVARRLQAQDLLGNCLAVDRMLEQWHATVYIQPELQTPVYWIRDPEGPDGQIPFEQSYVFTDGVTALAMIYYWAALVIFHPCIQRLYDAIYEPTVDGFWKSYSEDPVGMQSEPVKYAPDKVREMADQVCHSLDFALEATVQPDTLIFPLLIAQDYYGNIGRGYSAGDGQLEMMWCDAFRARLTQRGREIADVVRGRRWHDMAQY